MYRALWADSTFHRFIFTIDRDRAEQCRAAGCLRCGERLHSAAYPRKPRGVPEKAKHYYERRFSFTCRRCEIEKQRHRTTPPSVRFLGRKVWLATVVILISAMRDGPTDRRIARLAETLRIDRRTLEHWRRWWLETFTALPFWRAKAGAFRRPVDAARLPASLLDRFRGDAEERLIACLGFLAPITGGVSAQTY